MSTDTPPTKPENGSADDPRGGVLGWLSALRSRLGLQGPQTLRDTLEYALREEQPETAGAVGRIALFDPKGETAALLTGLGVAFETVGADADLAGRDVLIIGKEALTGVKNKGPKWKLCSFTLDVEEPLMIQSSAPIVHKGSVLGVTSSSGYGHTVKKNICYN